MTQRYPSRVPTTAFVAALGVAIIGCSGGGSGSRGTVAAGSGSATLPGASAPAPSPTPVPTPAPAPTPPPGPTFEVAGWLPYWSRTSGGQTVSDNAGNGLDELNPFWYGLEADGTLSTRTGARDQALITTVHNAGGLMIPTVFDVHDRDNLPAVLADPARRARAIAAMLDEIDRYGYDGIDIDFEHAKTATRDAFSAFVAEMSAAVRAQGKIFSLTIPGKRADRPSWVGYDYPALAPHADRVKIMTYGYSGPWSSRPGPIAPTDYQAQVLDYAITTMPADKIQLGIPFYGYDFPADGSRIRSVTWSSAQARLGRSPAGLQFVPARGETYFDYRDDAGVDHTVWLQDTRAIAAKCDVARRYGLRGIAIWSLGNEDPAFWDEIRRVLK